jgi:hypothetical protein
MADGAKGRIVFHNDVAVDGWSPCVIVISGFNDSSVKHRAGHGFCHAISIFRFADNSARGVNVGSAHGTILGGAFDCAIDSDGNLGHADGR